ncbi:MAG: N-acetyl-gamma-glutamyl-phosphate reductase [Verrucomicrobiota bacterium]
MNVGIVGASGYSGEELLRLLLRHPRVRVQVVTSRSLAGRALGEVLPGLRHLCGELCFELSEPEALAARDDVDLWFLALPHGVAVEYAGSLVAAGRKVIDLSADFRLGDPATYETYYGKAHPRPDLMLAAPYVIPELATDPAWRKAPLIASPGCYPTGIQLALVPLLRKGLIPSQGIVIDSASSVSGAGKKVAEDFIFCERNESFKAYGLPRHRHLSEIEEQLGQAAGRPVAVRFTPHLLPINRGIHSTITIPAAADALDRARACWQHHYQSSPFVQVLPEGQYPDTRTVAGTNRCDLSAFADTRTGHLILLSTIDNLLKGASGQAVQIMNLAANFPETDGLL